MRALSPGAPRSTPRPARRPARARPPSTSPPAGHVHGRGRRRRRPADPDRVAPAGGAAAASRQAAEPGAAAQRGLGARVRERARATCGSTWPSCGASSSRTRPGRATCSPSPAWATASTPAPTSGVADSWRRTAFGMTWCGCGTLCGCCTCGSRHRAHLTDDVLADPRRTTRRSAACPRSAAPRCARAATWCSPTSPGRPPTTSSTGYAARRAPRGQRPHRAGAGVALPAGFDAERRTPGSSADAVVWADVAQRVLRGVRAQLDLPQLHDAGDPDRRRSRSCWTRRSWSSARWFSARSSARSPRSALALVRRRYALLALAARTLARRVRRGDRGHDGRRAGRPRAGLGHARRT